MENQSAFPPQGRYGPIGCSNSPMCVCAICRSRYGIIEGNMTVSGGQAGSTQNERPSKLNRNRLSSSHLAVLKKQANQLTQGGQNGNLSANSSVINDNSTLQQSLYTMEDGSQAMQAQLDKDKTWYNKLMDSSGFALLLYSAGLLATSVINSLQFKRMTSAMPNYSAFLNQSTSVVYIPIFGLICCYMYYRNGWSAFGGDHILKFPNYKFATMGILDGASSVLMMIGGTYTTGSTQVVLGQTVIPVSLALNILFLNRKYHQFQYFGAVVIMIGVLVTKIPGYFHPEANSSSTMTTDNFDYNLVFMAGAIPNALSALYKEIAFNDVEMNINYMQFWVATWQFTIGFLLVPIQSLPVLGPQRVPLSHMASSMRDGLICLVTGHNTIVANCGGPNQPVCDNCGGAWLPVCTYILVNIAYNVFSLLVVKYGGATVSFLISTLRLPITTLAFSSPWIMGVGQTTTPSVFDILGLFVLFFGLVFYRIGHLKKAKQVPEGMQRVHFFTTTLDADPTFVTISEVTVAAAAMRHQLYNRLAIASPLLSPEHRERFSAYSPPTLPDDINANLPATLRQKYYEAPRVNVPRSNSTISRAGSVDFSRGPVDSEQGTVDMMIKWKAAINRNVGDATHDDQNSNTRIMTATWNQPNRGV